MQGWAVARLALDIQQRYGECIVSSELQENKGFVRYWTCTEYTVPLIPGVFGVHGELGKFADASVAKFNGGQS